MRGLLGPDPSDLKQITVLNRVVTWNKDNITYEADQRHAEILIKELLGTSAINTVVTPGITENDEVAPDDLDPLCKEDTALYRRCAARCNYLAMDRVDIQYAAKEVCRYMSVPNNANLRRLKRIARYLLLHPRTQYIYSFQTFQGHLKVYSDSNWAGCIATRKSTQGGAILFGQHCVKTWSSTQGVIALSSGEAE